MGKVISGKKKHGQRTEELQMENLERYTTVMFGTSSIYKEEILWVKDLLLSLSKLGDFDAVVNLSTDKDGFLCIPHAGLIVTIILEEEEIYEETFFHLNELKTDLKVYFLEKISLENEDKKEKNDQEFKKAEGIFNKRQNLAKKIDETLLAI